MVILVNVCLPERFLEHMGQQCSGSAMDSPVPSHRFPSHVPISEVSPQMSPVLCAGKTATPRVPSSGEVDKLSSHDGGDFA